MPASIVATRYTTVAITLHWLITLGILALIGLGLTMTHQWVALEVGVDVDLTATRIGG